MAVEEGEECDYVGKVHLRTRKALTYITQIGLSFPFFSDHYMHGRSPAFGTFQGMHDVYRVDPEVPRQLLSVRVRDSILAPDTHFSLTGGERRKKPSLRQQALACKEAQFDENHRRTSSPKVDKRWDC